LIKFLRWGIVGGAQAGACSLGFVADLPGVRRVNFGAMSDSPRLPGLALAEADQLVDTALAVAAERGVAPLAVAVLDVSGEVIALKRADGGKPATSRVAVAKARTALRMLQPSGEVALPSEVVGPIQHFYGGDFVARAGGILITDGDVVVGAIGASGAQSTQDEEAVRAAVDRRPTQA
jgi:uncharacterized protein GlcG (DUF336 family)